MSMTSLGDAERMDRHYRYQRYIYDATRTHYLLGRRHLISDLTPLKGDKVLEIGCGTAWNLVRVAKMYPHAGVVGLDVSSAMLATAETSLKRKGLEKRVVLAQGDATSFDAQAAFGQATFERIFFSYALSMIPAWREALAHCVRFLPRGGSLHIVDFGQCGQLPGLFRRALFAFLKHYTVTPRADLEDEIRKVAAANGLTYTFEKLHRGYTDYAVLRKP